MSKNSDKIPDFNDIIFENRNKEYGAYKLRKKYNIHLITGLLIGLVLISTVTVTPYLKEKSHGIIKVPPERSIVIRMQKLDIPKDKFVPPPPPPPPMEPHERIVQPQRYVAPQVVDTIMPEDTTRKLMTAEEAKTAVPAKEVVNQAPALTEVAPETKEEPLCWSGDASFPGWQSGTYEVYFRSYDIS